VAPQELAEEGVVNEFPTKDGGNVITKAKDENEFPMM
jgi:hypothetical protein